MQAQRDRLRLRRDDGHECQPRRHNSTQSICKVCGKTSTKALTKEIIGVDRSTSNSRRVSGLSPQSISSALRANDVNQANGGPEMHHEDDYTTYYRSISASDWSEIS